MAVVMGSESDWPTMQKAVEVLDRFGVAHEAQVLSAHRMPDEMFALRRVGRRPRRAGDHRRRRRRRSPAGHVGGEDDRARCSACPSPSRHLHGQDSLLSIVQMPAGVPVATFAIGEAGATNAGLFAVALLANDDGSLRTALERVPCRATSAGGRRGPRCPHADVSAAPGPIAPPATIGMLGGGQLGRYALVAARLAGYRTIVLDPDPAAPAGRVADEQLVAAYDDPAALDELASRCAVVTTEFENPPAPALLRLARDVVVAPAGSRRGDRPGPRRREDVPRPRRHPRRARSSPSPTTPTSTQPRRSATPAIVKTARLGYDGKGQRVVERPDGVAAAWEELGRVPCIVERRVDLDVEVSVVIARSADGAIATYPVAENVHVDGILDLTVVPARVDPAIADRGTALATQIAEALDYVGVLAVELFVSSGRLLVNELAPRPHNSGHWTLDAARTSQFAQQVRAITGAALGATSMTVPAVAMVNLLGDLWFPPDAAAVIEPTWTPILAAGDARLHLYGKSTPRPGRKMGHVTVLGDDVDRVGRRSAAIARRVRRETERRRRPAFGHDAVMQQPPERIELAAGVVLRRLQTRGRRRAAGRHRGEPRAPAPVHAVGRPGSPDHRGVRRQGERGLGGRRQLRLRPYRGRRRRWR